MLPPTAMLPLMSRRMARLIGRVAGIEVENLRGLPGVEHREVGLLKIADNSAVLRADGNADRHQIDTRLERGLRCAAPSSRGAFVWAESEPADSQDSDHESRQSPHAREILSMRLPAAAIVMAE